MPCTDSARLSRITCVGAVGAGAVGGGVNRADANVTSGRCIGEPSVPSEDGVVGAEEADVS